MTTFAQTASTVTSTLKIQSGLSNTWVITNANFCLATNAKAFTLSQNRGLSVEISGNASAEFTTGQVCLRLAIAATGTNFQTDTNRLLCIWGQPQGNTRYVWWSNFPPALVDNALSIIPYDLTNASCLSAPGVVCRVTNITFIQRY